MKKTPDISDEDRRLFRDAMKRVKTISSQEKIIKPTSKKPRIIVHPLQSESQLLDHIGEPKVTSETSLFFAKTGVQTRLIRRLKRGQFPIEARLDLHGQTIDQARNSLQNFMHEAKQAGFRCVIIIHGKSRLKAHEPKIKNAINQWIRQYSSVLAFTSAQSKDGGTGAIYVLLKMGPGPDRSPQV